MRKSKYTLKEYREHEFRRKNKRQPGKTVSKKLSELTEKQKEKYYNYKKRINTYLSEQTKIKNEREKNIYKKFPNNPEYFLSEIEKTYEKKVSKFRKISYVKTELIKFEHSKKIIFSNVINDHNLLTVLRKLENNKYTFKLNKVTNKLKNVKGYYQVLISYKDILQINRIYSMSFPNQTNITATQLENLIKMTVLSFKSESTNDEKNYFWNEGKVNIYIQYIAEIEK